MDTRKLHSGTHLSSIRDGLQRVYNPTVDEVLPFRFGKALGAVFLATTDLKSFARIHHTRETRSKDDNEADQ